MYIAGAGLLSGHSNLAELVWESLGVDFLAQLYRVDILKSFQELQQEFAIPRQRFF